MEDPVPEKRDQEVLGSNGNRERVSRFTLSLVRERRTMNMDVW